MTLAPGFRLGPYEIVGPLGAGGMGEVYRAKDTRLGREVAVKVLPQHLIEAPDVRARFEREARTVSSLNHPNICTLHDVGREGATDYLVMELVEGETLAARLERGALPLAEVLRTGIQIADALDRAHRAGVVHRDLKPGNVMLTRSGAKLMDFGLARASGAQNPSGGGSVTMATLQTMTPANRKLTAEGSIVGTFQYMPPEQLEGKEADTRSDLWALGCLLYESAAGRPAFAGPSQASLIGAIMHTEPQPLTEAMPLAPPALDRLVRSCLTKDPEERIQTAHDVRLQLEWIRDAGSQTAAPAKAAPRSRGREWVAWAFAAAGLAAAIVLLALRLAPAPAEEPLQASLLAPPGLTIQRYASGIVLSPDGRNLVFSAESNSGVALWLRPLGSEEARLIPESDLGLTQFWSPDGRWLAYGTLTGKLKKVATGGGEPTTICNLKWARGGTWGRQDVIVFAPAPEGPLAAVSAVGGEPRQVTTLDAARGQRSHRFPSFLPDGEHFLFVAMPAVEGGYETFVGSLSDGTVTKILTADSAAVYAEPGYLLFAREGKIMAQPFDAAARATAGEPAVIAEAPPKTDLDAEPVATASNDGRLAFLRTGLRQNRMEWLDRSGAVRGTIPIPPGPWQLFELSPDARHAAVMNGSDLWVVDLERAIPSRVAPTFSNEAGVTWLSDGRIAFSSNRSGKAEIYIGHVDSPAEPELVPTIEAQFKTIWDVSADGRNLVFGAVDGATSWDLWVLPLEEGGKPAPYAVGPGRQEGARISPDGRWLAYQSEVETNEPAVYVQSFPVPGRRIRISVGTGEFPLWTRGGKELLFEENDTLMSVPIAGGAEFQPGVPRPLLIIPEGLAGGDVTADGERFLVTVGPEPRRDIRIILNWTSLLPR